jgi:hypothetical protein
MQICIFFNVSLQNVQEVLLLILKMFAVILEVKATIQRHLSSPAIFMTIILGHERLTLFGAFRFRNSNCEKPFET